LEKAIEEDKAIQKLKRSKEQGATKRALDAQVQLK